MKALKQSIQEKLILNKNIRLNKNISSKVKDKFYILLGIYSGYDYLVDELGDIMITGDKGSGPNIFIVPYSMLLTLEKKYFEDKSISIFNIPDKYEKDIDQFEEDYSEGKINLDDDCTELTDKEYINILKKIN